MADNYLEFSETLTHLTDEQIDWLQNQLETVHVIDGVEYTEDKLPDATDTGGDGNGAWIGCRAYRDMNDYDPDYGGDVGFDYSFSEEVDENWGQHLWIHSEEHGYVDRVAHLVQKFLRMFRPDACWSLTYAGTCSKPRVGDFGGGAVFVTAADIKYFNTWEFVEKEEKRHKGKFKGDNTGTARTDSKAGTDGPRIVVNVSGGVVQDVYCSNPQADFVIVDWDTDGCDPTEGGIVEVGRQVAHVAQREVYPLDKLAGTDVGAALSVFEQVSIQEVTPVCECEQPGYFRSGVPGILARVENGRVVEGTEVERCDSCSRYPSDKAAFEKLVELGIAFDIASGEPVEPTLPPILPHAKQYIDAGRGFCPNCQSHQTEGDSVDFDGRHCTQRMRCLDCDAAWFDVYTLSSLSAVFPVEPRED
jgi:hypothetical protein